MKTLSDIFQAYSFEYDLVEDERFGTVGLLHTYESTSTYNLVNEQDMAALKAFGAVGHHFEIYIPNMTDEDVLALTGSGNLRPWIYAPIIPPDAMYRLIRGERSALSNFWHDLLDDPDFRAFHVKMTLFGISLVALNQLLDRAF